ncbi:hypothetical protein, partial [Actinomadura luteofluorescens]|uniref:hypothetical protein n=1 Tax=Actinomadura luteofluorescens TaxID=46163 RepID=UPI002164A190
MEALVQAGNLDQAESTACSTDKHEPAEASQVMGPDQARRAATDAEQAARAVASPYKQARALAGAVESLVQAGELDRARRAATDAEQA